MIAQTAISGRVDFEKTVLEPKVYLTKLSVEHIENLKFAKSVAWSEIKADGTFSFDKKHIADKDAVYHIYVKRFEKALKDTIAEGATFILSDSDVIDFSKKGQPFVDYVNSNQADIEWKKFKAFETELSQSHLAQEESAERLKSYAKDSLRILMVKLIGVKQLQEKQLLDQDIAKNPDFYVALLDELKESEMPRENYAFLEKRLAYLRVKAIEKNYALSKAINIVLGVLTLGFLGIFIFRRKRKPITDNLSRQERNVQDLILQGKTNKEIANELFISISTVKTHITNIYGKLRVSNRKELLHRTQN